MFATDEELNKALPGTVLEGVYHSMCINIPFTAVLRAPFEVLQHS